MSIRPSATFARATMTSDNTRPQQLSRPQRRRFEKLADRVDRMTKADRVFFERRPDRQHRVRLAHSAEIEQHEILDGPIAAPTGCQVFVAVKNIAPGHRLRLFVLGIEGSETDLSEEEACAIYEMPQTDKSREVEEAMRQLAKDWP